MRNQNEGPYPKVWVLVAALIIAIVTMCCAAAVVLFLAKDAAAQDDPPRHPLLDTGFENEPPDPYRLLRSQRTTYIQVMSDEQREAFAKLVGVPVPHETLKVIATTPSVRCMPSGCWQIGLVWYKDFIYWSGYEFSTYRPAIDVFETTFPDFYMIGVYGGGYRRGTDGNPHGATYYWVRRDEFDFIFPPHPN